MAELSRKWKIAVIGAGSWGTALADLLAEKGHDVVLWVREEEVFHQIQEAGENRAFMPGVPLDRRLRPVMTYKEALDDRELVVLVVPSHVIRGVIQGIRPYIREDTVIVTGTKGIENDTLMTVSEVVRAELPVHDPRRFASLAGPSFAREVCRRLPTAVSVACPDGDLARTLQDVFSTNAFRVYASRDLVGTQLAGALKNVIAIGAGVSDGLDFGDNARAALITRGLAEITRLAVALGANPHTLAGLSGMGDLVLTCTGDLSRNRTVGLKIGGGIGVPEITSSMNMVAEGVKTARSAHELGRKAGVELPIIDQVYYILYEGKDPNDAVRDLMARRLKEELEG
ncbi:MAG: NAD(P)H-dependent glycerol-3-phosphate dehydrogenase [Thermodesulfobacteriota bacterium]